MTTPGNNKEISFTDLVRQVESEVRSVAADTADSVELSSIQNLSIRGDGPDETVTDDDLEKAKQAISFLDNVKGEIHRRESHDTVIEYSTSRIPIEKLKEPKPSQYPDFRADRLGRFEILELIGQGGFAKVFRANDPLLKRDVALKIPKPQVLMSEEAVLRFKREAESAAVLSHPSIVPVFESGLIGPIAYIASEYFPGQTLSGWFASENREIDCSLAARIIRELADAIEHAHQRGIVHRDLKPANILVGESDDDVSKRLRITDFGLAKQIGSTDDSITVIGAVIGTPAYMSPEQARADKEVGALSDVFSLGVILYELLTGELPFQGEHQLSTIRLIEDGTFKRPRSIKSTIPKDLECICLKCMHLETEDRYANAFELSDDLRRWLEERPVKARPLGSLQKLSRWNRRNPLLAGALLFALMSLVTGLGMTAWKWNESNRNWQASIQQRNRANRHAELTQRTLDDVLGKVTDELKNRPEFNELRSQLVADAVELQERLLNEEPDNQKIRFETAKARFRLASLQNEFGQYPEAELTTERVEVLLEEVRPTEEVTRQEIQLLGFDSRLIRAVSFQNRYKSAKEREVLDALLADVIEAAEAEPSGLLLQRVVECWLQKASAPSGGKGVIFAAEKALEALQQVRPKSKYTRYRKAVLLRILAGTKLARRNGSEAEEYIEKAKQTHKLLQKDNPNSVKAKFERARLLRVCGEYERVQGRFAEAVDSFMKARKIVNELKDDFPNVASYADQYFRITTDVIRVKYRTEEHDDITRLRRDVATEFAKLNEDLALSAMATQNASLAMAKLAVTVSEDTDEDPEPFLKNAVKLTLLHESNPPWAGCRRNTFVCYQSYAAAMKNRGKHELTLKYAEKAVAKLHTLLPDYPVILPMDWIRGTVALNCEELIYARRFDEVDDKIKSSVELLGRELPPAKNRKEDSCNWLRFYCLARSFVSAKLTLQDDDSLSKEQRTELGLLRDRWGKLAVEALMDSAEHEWVDEEIKFFRDGLGSHEGFQEFLRDRDRD